MPTLEESIMFKDRLEEHELKNFEDLDNLKHPKTLKKMDKAEQFIVKILKNQEVIEKSKLLQRMINIDSILDITDTEFIHWNEVHEILSANDSQKKGELILFQKILSVALYVSQLMSNG
jgi:citrate lyase synthetase